MKSIMNGSRAPGNSPAPSFLSRQTRESFSSLSLSPPFSPYNCHSLATFTLALDAWSNENSKEFVDLILVRGDRVGQRRGVDRVRRRDVLSTAPPPFNLSPN